MKRLLTAVAFIATIAIAPVQAQTIDQLLKQVKSGSIQKTKAAADLERRFASAGAGKAAIVNELRSQRASLESRSDSLEAEYAKNDEELNVIRNSRERSLGDLKELFGAVQQVVGEAQAGFETSAISAQFPGRGEQFVR